MAQPPTGPFRLPQGAVDCHAHVLKKDVPLTAIRHSTPARDVPVQEYLALLDTYGVTFGLLAAPSFYGSDNSILLDALAKSKGRARGTVLVEPDISEAELNSMKEQGACGIRLNWIHRPSLPDTGSAAYQGLFDRVANLGMHVEVFIEDALLEQVIAPIQRSKAKVVLDHFGCPDAAHGVQGKGFRYLLDRIAAGNTWVKLSGPYRLGNVDLQSCVDALLKAGGGERLVWASDWPWVSHETAISYQRCIDLIFEWVPDEKVRNQILVQTPQALFGFRQ